jgi:hypothetical protein
VFYELKMFVYEVQAERQMRLYLQGVLLRAMKKVVEEASFGRDAKALSHFYYRIVGKSFLRWRRIVRVKKRVAIKYRKARLAIERMKKVFLMSKLRQFVVFMRREKERGLQNYDPN